MSPQELIERLRGSFPGELLPAEQIRVRLTRFAGGITHVDGGEAQDLSLASWGDYRTRQGSTARPTQRKDKCPIEVGAILRDGRRRDDAAEAVTWIFLDVDDGATAWEQMQKALDILGAAYLLTESTSSGMPGKGLRWHLYLPLEQPWVTGPGRGKQEWRAIYAQVCRVLAQLGEIPQCDKSVDDLSQPVYVALQPDGYAPRRVEWSAVGRPLDLDALLAATSDYSGAQACLDTTNHVPSAASGPAAANEPVPALPGVATSKGATGTTGETTGSLCKKAAEDLLLLGPAIDTNRWMLLCPWRQAHSPGCVQREHDQYDSSTVIFLTGVHGEDGGFDCRHNHSAGEEAGVHKTAADFLSYARRHGAVLPDRDGYNGAARAAALADPAAERKRIFGQVIDELNATHAVVRIGGRVLIVWTHDDSLTSKNGFFDWYANAKLKFIDDAEKPQTTSKAAIWWGDSRRRQYASLAFRPDLNREQSEREGIYNLWQGFTAEPEQDGDCTLFKNHLLHNVCGGNAEHYRYLFGWFAQMFQRPRERPGVALVLKSAGKGTGKSFVGEVFGHLLGGAYRSASQAKHITGNFNSHLERTLFLLAEEAVWAGSRADQGVLQDLITNQTLTIERKGIDTYTAPNYVHLMITSNGDWVVPASSDERRYAILEVGEAQKQNGAYFGAIKAQLEAGGYGRLLYELLHFDLASVDLNRVPQTAALTEQKITSARGLDAWLFEACGTGVIPGSRGADPTMPGGVVWPEDTDLCVARKVLFDSYLAQCAAHREHPPNATSFGMQLRKIISVGSSDRGLYWLPALAEVRAAIEKKYGIKSETREPVRVAPPVQQVLVN